MGLRKKTALVIGSTLILLFLIIYMVTNNTILTTFDKLQREDIRKDIERVNNALVEENNLLDRACREIAQSSDAGKLLTDPNNQITEHLLADYSFADLKLNFVYLIDMNDNIIFKKAFDLGSNKAMAFPESLNDPHFLADKGFLTGNSTKPQSGILVLPESPAFFSLKPVYGSNGSKLIGCVAAGRFLDSNTIQNLAKTANIYHLNIFHVKSVNSTREFAQIVHELNSGTLIYTEYISGGSIAGYAYVKDLFGKPAIISKADKPAKIFQAGETNARIWLLLILLVGALFIFAILTLMDRLILSKLFGLKKQVSQINLEEQIAPRIRYQGHDELASLADTINQLIERTERSQAELKESESNYRHLFNSVNDAVFLHLVVPGQSRLDCLETNVVTCRILGYTRLEILAMNNLNFVCPEDQVFFMEKLASLKANQKSIFDIRMITRDDQLIPFEFSSQAFELHHQLVVLSMARDVTIRKKAEAELNTSYREEQTLRHALEDEIKRRAEFFKALVHELKTPLTPILASSESILAVSKEEIILRLANNIFRGAERLNSRVDELLDIARGEMGVLKVKLKPMNMDLLVSDVVEYMRPQFETNQQSLDFEKAESIPAVMGDESRLRQVLINLLNNSNKFTGHGGLIKIRVITDGAFVTVEIEDNGIGIEDSEKDRLFQPYNRIEDSAHHFSGLGLGLALSKQIVDLHNGKIWVTSRKGVGSTFHFSVPANIEWELIDQSVSNKNYRSENN